ncbi:hypothetical protein [Natronococcus jeotgali]|uniref:hypothetical protein n=1 Tax=Natronococcus jeotgali TaxID=413812 RepID=UPI0012684EE4|nr:hypothetical protein [Natronococcus jeotgali]
MALESLIDTALAGFKRSRELEAENRSEYKQWHSELESELEVFLYRAKEMNLEESSDRHEFYDYIEKFENRLRSLRSRSEASEAPTQALVEIENLVDLAENTDRPVYAVSVNFKETPLERQRREKKEEERNQRLKKRIEGEVTEFVQQIELVRNAFEGDS